ncbi:MAG TPA: hypothetical protein DCG75_06890 [Bacteroidales bacterium]|nr:hypothetical protein [Bacteroidales bacterium]
MIREIVKTKSIEEIEEILFKQTDDYYFIEKELKSVEHKNTIKSLGARYLIKLSILEFLKLTKEFNDIEIENEESGKPILIFKGEVKDKLKENGISNVHVSISHSKNYISTLVILE